MMLLSFINILILTDLFYIFFVCTVGFEMWHLELITGLVLLISSFRYLLLKIWPDFAKSSEAANQQVGLLNYWLPCMLVILMAGWLQLASR